MGWFGGVAALLITVASGILVHLVLTKQSLQVHARPFIALIHLLATVLSSGVQLWTTFAFGLIAFKHLPRHVFGNLQGNLFPVYFTVVSVCTVLQLLAVYWLTDSLESSTPARVQFQVLLVALAGVLANIIVFEPATSSVMHQRHKFEREHSTTVGGPSSVEIKDLKAKYPQYKQLCGRFGMVHGLSSLANLVTLAAGLVHVWYLSSAVMAW